MRIASQLMNGLVYEARLVPVGDGMLLELEENEFLSPEDATFGEFAIAEATDEERTSLEAAGYAMSDYVPAEATDGGACGDTQCGALHPATPPPGKQPGDEILH